MLDAYMKAGLTENEFWDMTLAELERYGKAYVFKEKQRKQEIATFIYKLGDLIGASNSRIHTKNGRYPDIEEAFPTLFDTEEIKEAKRRQQIKNSVSNFINFANAYNKAYGGKEQTK